MRAVKLFIIHQPRMYLCIWSSGGESDFWIASNLTQFLMRGCEFYIAWIYALPALALKQSFRQLQFCWKIKQEDHHMLQLREQNRDNFHYLYIINFTSVIFHYFNSTLFITVLLPFGNSSGDDAVKLKWYKKRKISNLYFKASTLNLI